MSDRCRTHLTRCCKRCGTSTMQAPDTVQLTDAERRDLAVRLQRSHEDENCRQYNDTWLNIAWLAEQWANELLQTARADQGEIIAQAIEGQRLVCPVHGISDCSALFNGCVLVARLHARLAVDAQIARQPVRGGA